MWRHKNCGGMIVQSENYEISLCLICDQEMQNNSEIYLDHYILKVDGNIHNIGDLGGSHV